MGAEPLASRDPRESRGYERGRQTDCGRAEPCADNLFQRVRRRAGAGERRSRTPPGGGNPAPARDQHPGPARHGPIERDLLFEDQWWVVAGTGAGRPVDGRAEPAGFSGHRAPERPVLHPAFRSAQGLEARADAGDFCEHRARRTDHHARRAAIFSDRGDAAPAGVQFRQLGFCLCPEPGLLRGGFRAVVLVRVAGRPLAIRAGRSTSGGFRKHPGERSGRDGARIGGRNPPGGGGGDFLDDPSNRHDFAERDDQGQLCRRPRVQAG